jgi:hypothetical protein
MDKVVVLGASIATTLVGWLLLVYIWSVRRTAKRHVLRSDEIGWLSKHDEARH